MIQTKITITLLISVNFIVNRMKLVEINFYLWKSMIIWMYTHNCSTASRGGVDGMVLMMCVNIVLPFWLTSSVTFNTPSSYQDWTRGYDNNLFCCLTEISPRRSSASKVVIWDVFEFTLSFLCHLDYDVT